MSDVGVAATLDVMAKVLRLPLPAVAPAPQARRPKGTGSIVCVRRPRPSGGETVHYRVRVSDPLHQGRLALDRTYASRAEARRALQRATAFVALGEPVPDPGLPVAKLLTAYQETIRATRKHRAYRSIEHKIRLWIRPSFEGMTVGEMNSARVMREFTTHLRRAVSAHTHRPLEESTIGDIVELVGAILEMARREGVIRTNAARETYTGKPHGSGKRRHPNLPSAREEWFSQEESLRYLALAPTMTHGDLLAFTLITGLRSGEARGLLEENCHLDAAHPYIEVLTKVVVRDLTEEECGPVGTQGNRHGGGRGEGLVVTDELKSDASYRRLYLPEPAVPLLRSRLAWRSARRQEASRWDRRWNLVFTTRFGTPIASGFLLSCHHAVCRRAGVPHIHVHGLRHTCLSLLLAGQVPLKEVAQFSGHDSLRELEETYAHVLAEFRLRGAQVMAAMLASAPAGDDPPLALALR